MQPMSARVGPAGARVPGDAIVVARRFAVSLRTTHRETFETELGKTPFGEDDLGHELPPERAASYDEGIVRVGVEVAPGDVLVARRTFGPRGPRDSSLRVQPGVAGTVIEAGRSGSQISVMIGWDRPLAIGDTLEDGQGRCGTVAEIADDLGDCDLLWGDEERTATVRKTHSARDVAFARSIGPYSLVTQQPLSGKQQFGGQPVEPTTIDRLAAAGASANLIELLAIKTDHVWGRTRAFEQIVKGERDNPIDLEGQMPEVANAVQAELWAMGLACDLRAPELQVRPIDDAFVVEHSRGALWKPESIDYRTYKPVEGGLFCQKLFGPVRDYECGCGKYTRMRNRGIVCEECGVEVCQSKVRRERFAHIELSEPVVMPWFENVVATLLGEPSTDGATTAARLRSLDLRNMAADGHAVAAQLVRVGIEPGDLVVTKLLVLPPDLRPLVPLEAGRWATSDLNDLYRDVINRNNRLRRLIELGAPETIITSERIHVRDAIARLVCNERTPSPASVEGRALRSLEGIASLHLADLVDKRVDYAGVAPLVPVSGERCRLSRRMAREILKPWIYEHLETNGHVDTIKVAKKLIDARTAIAEEALDAVATGYPMLLERRERLASCEIEPWDHDAIGVTPEIATQLGATFGGDLARVFAPITEAACDEVCHLGTMPDPLAWPREGWFAAAIADGDIASIARAALLGEVDPVRDPRIRAALGRS